MVTECNRFVRKLAGLLLVLVGVISLVENAYARNVPGSASAAIGELSEVSSVSLINSIHNGLLRVRRDDRTGVSSFAASFSPVDTLNGENNGTLAFQGGNAVFLNENGFGTAINLEFRNVDNADVDADIFDGSALLLYRPSRELLLFGGVIGEHLDGDTPFNAGTIEADGFGVAGGFDYQTDSQVSITGTLAYLFLDYAVTRTGGAISGSFDATRFMADLQATSYFEDADIAYRMNIGARYINQDNDGYVESGGAVIGSSSHTTFSALAGIRAQFRTDGADPFFETDIRYDLEDNSNLPVGVADPNSTLFNARFGAGLTHEVGDTLFEIGVGVHTSEDGYDGYDGRLRAVIRF